MTVRILHTNDFHGTLNDAREERLRSLRANCDLYFDCGDAIKSGNLGIPVKDEEAWTRLARLGCSASVLGNRETHILTSAFDKKMRGRSHPVLCANLHAKRGPDPLPGSLVIHAGGVCIGVVGVMVPMVTRRMATQAASAYLWDAPIPTAVALAESLRNQVDCLIAITHIGLRHDKELAERTPLFDLILGGHSHDVLQQPVIYGNTAICQTGSHGRFAGVYEWSPTGLDSYALVPLA